MTPEGKTKKLISNWLKKHSIPYWMIIPSQFGRTTGVSDYVCIIPDNCLVSRGSWLAIEAKANGKKDTTTKNQRDFLDTIKSNGGISIVVSCQEDLDELESILYGK